MIYDICVCAQGCMCIHSMSVTRLKSTAIQIFINRTSVDTQFQIQIFIKQIFTHIHVQIFIKQTFTHIHIQIFIN